MFNNNLQENVEKHQPAILNNPGRIIVIGDIHGDIDRLIHIFISLHIS